MCYSLWCNAYPTMLPAEGRQHRGVCMWSDYTQVLSLVNDFVYSFGRAALLLLVEV